MLKVNNLNAYYGNLNVLRDINLEVHEKELVTLIGANGAGKSTFLMAVSGMLKRTSGTIDFENTRISGLQPHLIVGMGLIHVPQERHLFPEMTVLENLEMGARQARDKKEKSMQQRLKDVFNIFELLGHRKNQLAGTMSGGEQQMLAIARGLMGSPRLLLLDEPSFGLAPIIVKELEQVLRGLHKGGLSILLVEQNAKMALGLADRGYVLQSGNMVASGPACDLVKNEVVKRAYLGGA